MEGLLAWLETVEGMLTKVSTGVFLVCIVAAGIMFATSGGKEPQGAKKWVLNILVAVAVVSFGTAIITGLMI